MAQRDPKRAPRRDARPGERPAAEARPGWRSAALGGALVALGGALFGVGARRAGAEKAGSAARGRGGASAKAKPGNNDGGRRPEPEARPNVGRSKVRTKPNAPEVTGPTRYWPPPPPKPLDVYDDGVRPPETEVLRVHGPVDAAAVKRGYESGDAKPGTIVKVMLSSALVIVGCIAGLFYLIGRQHRDDVRGPPLTPQQLAVIVPPGPHLQDHPLHDIAMENKREFDLLKYYAWTGPDHRAGRIPIERAQALVSGRPLDPLPTPAAPAAPAPASNP